MRDPRLGGTVKLKKGTIVGVMLVTTSARVWEKKPHKERARRLDVVTLGVHRLFRHNYVPDALWTAMVRALQTDAGTNQGRIRLVVAGGSCLNNQRARDLYTMWGFAGPERTHQSDPIVGWFLEFLNGEPQYPKQKD